MGSYVPSSVYHQPTLSPGTFRFDDLVYDIQAYIISYFICVPDLVSLTLVSRHVNSLATPALYADVKFLSGWKHRPSSDVSRAEDGAFTTTLLSAQRAFKTELLSHPERARHIRSLAWQFWSSNTSSGHAFADLFPLLQNLTAIHVVDAHPTDISELKHNIQTLFPRVNAVKFTGITSLTFATPMLHTPQRITALSLDTIEPHSAHMHLLQWISTADLSSLRVLSLRATPFQRDPKRKTEILLAWKEALSAVRHTVAEVTLGVTQPWMVPGRSAVVAVAVGGAGAGVGTVVAAAAGSSPSSAERRFAQPLLPIFWEESWPCLERLRLEGIEVDEADAARLAGVVRELDVDSTVQLVKRVWNSMALQRF